MPRPIENVKLAKRVRTNRNKWDAKTHALHAELQAEADKLEDMLARARRDFPGLTLRPTPQAMARAQELRQQILERKKQTRDKLRALHKERAQAKFRLHQLGNLHHTIRHLTRRIATLERRLELGVEDVALRAKLTEDLAACRAALPEQQSRVTATQQAAEDAEAVIDAAFAEGTAPEGPPS